MTHDGKSTPTTPIAKPVAAEIDLGDRCQHCGDICGITEEIEAAIDHNGVAVGVVHSGHCAHQWRIRVCG